MTHCKLAHQSQSRYYNLYFMGISLSFYLQNLQYLSFMDHGKRGTRVKFNNWPVCLLGKYKSLLQNAFCTLIRSFLRYHPSKLELEALAGTLSAVTPTSGPNIYITWSVKRTGKICGRHDKRSKIICGAVHNVLSSSLHYSTQWSCWRTVMISPVQWWDVSCFSLNICQGGNVDIIRAFSDCLNCIWSHHWTSDQNSPPAGLLGGVM